MKQLNLLDLKNKRCSRCGKVKPISEFGEEKRVKNKLQSQCRKCRNKSNEKWRKNNPKKDKESKRKWAKKNSKKERERKRKWKEDNPEKVKESCRKYRENNPEYMKEWREKNPEKARKWEKDNPEKVKKIRRKAHKKFLSIPKNRLNKNISLAISYSLKGNKKGNHWEDLVGYTLKDLMAHLESQFKPGMNWDNMGEWQIDHIRPISSFSFNSYNDSEFKECWRLKNLQPLWKFENLSKGAKY